MNREDMIRMAIEAGFNVEQGYLLRITGIDEDLERFAALVASAERERIKQANAPEIERINAHIKEALALQEHPAQMARLGWQYVECPACGLEGARAFPKPEQEPVAWLHRFIEGGISIGLKPADLERHPERWEPLYTEPTPCPTCEALARTVMLDQTSHDTTPLQRTWVGLTDEEFNDAINYKLTPRCIAIAIEAKLKEKNL